MEQVLESKSSETVFACYNCGNEVSNDALFCKDCGTQVKCKTCKSLLEENASFCINCGTEINSRIGIETTPFNNFDYTQKGNSKTIKAKFTNEVGVYLASAFNSVITGQPIPPKNPFRNSLQITSPKTSVNAVARETSNNIQDVEVVETNFTDTIAKIFKQNSDGKLEIEDNRLKEKSKFDKIKRLAVLYVYAKKLSGYEFTERKELNNIISQQKLALKDFRKFLSMDMQKYFSEKEKGKFTLIAGGTDYAEKILEEIANPDYQATTSKAGRKTGKKSSNNSSSSSESAGSKKSNSTNPSGLDMMKKLIAENYFTDRKKLNDIVNYCSEKKAVKFSPQLVSIALSRLVKDEILDREKKDGQYEYWKK